MKEEEIPIEEEYPELWGAYCNDCFGDVVDVHKKALNLIIKFIHKFHFMTEEQRKEVACRFDYITKEGILIKDDPFSWNVCYFEIINNTKLSKKMLRHIK